MEQLQFILLMKIKNWIIFIVVISKFTVFAPQNFVLRLNSREFNLSLTAKQSQGVNLLSVLELSL